MTTNRHAYGGRSDDVCQIYRCYSNVLTEPAILIGILVGVGYALDKKTPIKIITGMISAMVGLMMVLFGGFQFSATFKPVAEAVSKAYGVHGYLMDSYAMKAATQIALGDNFGYVGYVLYWRFY